MTILERLRTETGPLKVHDANDLAYDAGFHGENYALMVAALRGGVDAVGSALALVERMLPGSLFDLSNDPHRWYFRFIGGNSLPINRLRVVYSGDTAPLAILVALFTALEAKERT